MSFLGGPMEAGEAALWESKPTVPDFHWTDLVQQQMDTAQGNLDVLPQAEKLGAGVDDFMRGEKAKNLATIPGFSDIEGQTTSNIKNWLSGNLDPNMASQISRASNAQAFAGGYGGSGGSPSMYPTMKSNLQARDLGLGVNQIQQQGQQAASQYMGQEYNMRNTPTFDPTQMFINPMQAAQFNNQQDQQKWQRDWLASQIQSQPEPWQQSIMNSTQQGGAMMDSIVSSFMGGAAGGAGKSAGGMMMGG